MDRDELEREFRSGRPPRMVGQARPSPGHDEAVLTAARAAATRIRARRSSGHRWTALAAFAAGLLLGFWLPGSPWRRSPGVDPPRRTPGALVAPAGPERVAFRPYQEDVHYLTIDRADIKEVRDIYASPEAVRTAKAGQPLPRGTVLTLLMFRAKVDAKGELVRDRNGRLIKSDLERISVMEKREGGGLDYAEEARNGEWEFAAFLPDGTRNTAADIRACLGCHKPKSAQDFVFTFPELARAWK